MRYIPGIRSPVAWGWRGASTSRSSAAASPGAREKKVRVASRWSGRLWYTPYMIGIRACRYRYARAVCFLTAFTRVRSAGGCTFFPPPPYSYGTCYHCSDWRVRYTGPRRYDIIIVAFFRLSVRGARHYNRLATAAAGCRNLQCTA